MTNTNSLISYHSLRWRIVIASMLLIGLLLALGLFFVLQEIWVEFGRHNPEFMGVLLAFRLAIFVGLGIPVITGLLLFAWCHRFVFYRYRLDNCVLQVYDPILHRSWSIKLDDMATIREANPCKLTSAKGQAAYARILNSEDGQKVWLLTDLPIWPEIERLCTKVSAHYQ